MSDVLSNWAANTAVAAMLPSGCYLACHLSDPTVLGNSGTELAGGGYVRQPIKFTAPSNRGAVSTNAQTFAGLPASTITHLAVWTAIAGGHMVFTKALSGSGIAVPDSGQLLVAAGDVAVSL